MWLAMVKANRAVGAVFFLPWITFFLMALVHEAGGYTGLLTAAAALSLAAAKVLLETTRREILPTSAG